MQFQISNESNDHKYFTIIPNYILNHSTATAQALYLQLKRLAGENGLAYPGNNYLLERLQISRKTLKKEFDYLLEKGWIEYVGEKKKETKGGKQKIKTYKIIDLWQLNNRIYGCEKGVDKVWKKGGENVAYLPKGGGKCSPKGGENVAPKKIYNNNNNIYTKKNNAFLNKKNISKMDTRMWGNSHPLVKKPYYDGFPMRYVKDKDQWFVLKGREWFEFVGRKEEIQWI